MGTDAQFTFCRIGATVGVVEKIDVTTEGMGWGKFLWVKILIDITEPLSWANLESTSQEIVDPLPI